LKGVRGGLTTTTATTTATTTTATAATSITTTANCHLSLRVCSSAIWPFLKRLSLSLLFSIKIFFTRPRNEKFWQVLFYEIGSRMSGLGIWLAYETGRPY